MGTYPALAKGRGKPEGTNRLDKGLVHVFSFAFAFFLNLQSDLRSQAN